jgi:hypothetical protein
MLLCRRYGPAGLYVSEATGKIGARRTLFVWGWLRWALGCVQIVSSIGGLILFLKFGATIETGIVVGAGFVAFAASRWIYRGRRFPGD